jgi:hypothetical protein
MNEARSCLNLKAYRMAVVAATTSVHLGMYFHLLCDGIYKQNPKIPNFSKVIEKAEGLSLFDDETIKRAKWLMWVRNAYVHPEDLVICKSHKRLDRHNKASYHVTFQSARDPPKLKLNAFRASDTNNLENLRKIAEKAIKKAEYVSLKAMFIYDLKNVEEREV